MRPSGIVINAEYSTLNQPSASSPAFFLFLGGGLNSTRDTLISLIAAAVGALLSRPFSLVAFIILFILCRIHTVYGQCQTTRHTRCWPNSEVVLLMMEDENPPARFSTSSYARIKLFFPSQNKAKLSADLSSARSQLFRSVPHLSTAQIFAENEYPG